MIIGKLFSSLKLKIVRNIEKYRGTKEYDSYAHAMSFCTSDAYQNRELCNMIADKTLIHIDTLNCKPFILNPSNVYLLAAINQYLIENKTDRITILDFGGACGGHYFDIRRFIPAHITLKWIVVETDQMVKSAINRELNNEELIFVNSIEEAGSSIDLIHSSGSLQYVPNPYEFIDKLVNVKAKRIFITRMMFNEEDRDFVTIQSSLLSDNGYGKLPKGYTDRITSYPHTTLSFQKFNAGIISHDYTSEWLFEEKSGSYQIKNERIIGKGILYLRKD